jgi:PPM family protein phosphatase
MLEAYQFSDRGCVRPHNEDYCVIDPRIGLFVLADGMGGARAGEHASRMAVETVVEVVRAAETRDARLLLAAIEEANRRVLEASRANRSMQGMGTTLVAALETGPDLFIASVGDSRAYILDAAGFRAITEDQTWVNEVGRSLGLDEDALRVHPLRHILTMAVGSVPSLRVKSYTASLEPGAVVMLSSDGLHGVLPASVMEEILRCGCADLEVCCRSLVEAAIRAGGPDNITVALLRQE